MSRLQATDLKVGPLPLSRARQLLARIALTGPWFESWEFRLENYDGSSFDGHDYFLQLRGVEDDNYGPGKVRWGGRKWHISNYATDSEFFLTAWKAVHTAIEHEARENFKIDNLRVFDPHTSVEDLIQAVRFKEVGKDVRPLKFRAEVIEQIAEPARVEPNAFVYDAPENMDRYAVS